MPLSKKKRSQPPRRHPWVKWLFLLPLILFCATLGRPLLHLAGTALNDEDDLKPVPQGYADDASRMNETAVTGTWDIPKDPALAERQLQILVKKAAPSRLKISIAGARHSMGGHTIYPGGIVLNMLPFNRMELDEKKSILTVGAGARWSEIIPFLQARGFSVEVMQSNNPFTIGGSLSVNCHGWQPNHAPIASTVESFRLMKSDGTILTCSRTENPELFSLVLGGYGLFGIILDADLKVVPDEVYRPERFMIPLEKYAETFEEKVAQRPDAGLAYGRLCPAPDRFLKEAILTVYYRVPGKKPTPYTPEPSLTWLKRLIFRGSVGSDYGKNLRWKLEKDWGEKIGGGEATRDEILNEGIEVFENRSGESTDILHEYFIPKDKLAAFIGQSGKIIPAYRADLLNLTVRDLKKDRDSFLNYADQDLFALVMLFHEGRDDKSDQKMEAMTQELIQAALNLGGRYYLPYRLHATRDQFKAAYPQSTRFFALKKKYDPYLLFQNEFYLKYGQ